MSNPFAPGKPSKPPRHGAPPSNPFAPAPPSVPVDPPSNPIPPTVAADPFAPTADPFALPPAQPAAFNPFDLAAPSVPLAPPPLPPMAPPPLPQPELATFSAPLPLPPAAAVPVPVSAPPILPPTEPLPPLPAVPPSPLSPSLLPPPPVPTALPSLEEEEVSLPPPPAALPSWEEEVSLPPPPPAAPPMSPFLSSPPPLPSLPVASVPVVPPPLVEAPPPVPPVFEAPAAFPIATPPVPSKPAVSMDPPALPSHPAVVPQKPQRHGSGANLRSAVETAKSATVSDPFASESFAKQDPFGASDFGASPVALKAWDVPSSVALAPSTSLSSAVDPFAPSGNGAEDDVFGSSAVGSFPVSSTHLASSFSNDAFATDSFSDAFAASTTISSAAAVSDPFAAASPISNIVPNTVQAPTSFPEIVTPVVAAPQLPSFVPPEIPPAVPSLPLEDDNPVGLPKLAPQLDDDPFDLHINRPLPVPVPAPAAVASAPAVVAPKAVSKPAIEKGSEGGDPFAVLIAPLKPVVAVAAATTTIASGVPLKTLMETNKPAVGVAAPQIATSTTVVPPGGSTQMPSNPFALNASAAPTFPPATNVTPSVANVVSPPVAPAAGQIGNSDPFGLPPAQTLPADPFGMDSSNADPFGLGSVAPIPSKAAPFGEPLLEETQAAEDTFGPCDDPFAAGFTPAPPAKKQPVAATADLLGGSDLDIFSSVPAPAAVVQSSAPTAAARIPPPLPARTSRPTAAPKTGAINTAAFVAAKQSSAAPTGDLLDGFDFASGPTKATTNAAASTPSNPFAPTTTTSTPSTAAATDLFGDDPFVSHGEAGDHHEDSAEDVMRRLRRAYSLHSDQSEEVEEEDEDLKPITKVLVDDSVKSSSSRGTNVDPVTARVMSKITGDILTRFSTKSMLTKDWRDHFYVIDRGVMMIFKSRMDYEFNPIGSTCKMKLPITYNMRVLQIKAKEYKGYGTLYNFMLEQIEDFGVVNIGKFASTFREVVEALWKKLRDVILYRREQRNKQIQQAP